MRECIFVLPEFDDASKYSHLWGTRLIEQVKDKLNVILLERENATREKFEKALQEHLEADICFEDHGGEDCLYAQDGLTCILDSGNVDKVAGKIIYSMACLSAKKLGVEAWKRGCIYVGYVETFTFTVADEHLFCQAANSGFIAYIQGEHDWAKVKTVMVEAFNHAMQQTNDPWAKLWLQYDRDALRVYAPGADEPETTCLFRKAAILLFGSKIGWKLSRTFPVSVALYFLGFGITIHDLYCEIVGPSGNPYRIHGGYIGLVLMLIGFLLAYCQVWTALKKT